MDDFEKSVDEAIKEYERILIRNLDMAADLVANKAKENIEPNVDTGLLRAETNNLGVVVEGDNLVAYVGSTVPYAVYIHQGTGIHATNGDGRKTPWSYTDPKTGKKIWTKGTHANPYLKNAVESESANVSKLIGGA